MMLATSLSILWLAAAVGAAGEPPDTPYDVVRLHDIRGELSCNGALLADLGLGLQTDSTRTLRTRSTDDSDGLAFTLAAGAFGRWLDRSAALAGLTVHSRASRGQELRLQPGPAAREVAIAEADGKPLLIADHAQLAWSEDRRRLELANMDVRLAPALAERLGRPQQAGLGICGLDLYAAVRLARSDRTPIDATEGAIAHGNTAAGNTAGGAKGFVDCTEPNFGARVDIALTRIDGIGQTLAQDGRVAITPAARLRNVGTAEVVWRAAFDPPGPPYDNSQHPFLVWALYRIDGGVIEPLGQSDAKHAFNATNVECSCGGGDILWSAGHSDNTNGAACEDTYAKSTNEDRDWLAPREEITAHTGVWERCGSSFDPDCDRERDHGAASPHEPFEHYLAVSETALDVDGARYLMEAWYVVRDDVDVFNSMAHRAVVPQLADGMWSFPADGGTTGGPAIDAWVDPDDPDHGAQSFTLDTGEGRLRLAARGKDLGSGRVRAHYALMNVDFDRRIDAFELHFDTAPGTTVTKFAGPFNDFDFSDWNTERVEDTITWTAPSTDAALDWGTMYTFSVEADTLPSPKIRLSVLESGTDPSAPAELELPALDRLFSDGMEP